MLNAVNPWRDLPSAAPFVLSCDATAIEEFHAGDPPAWHRLHLELLSEPFLGRPYAPVVLLNLNPGFNDQDVLAHENGELAEAATRNLVHAQQRYPSYLRDPRFREASGARWWRTHLAQLLARFGDSRVANAIACVEYFPYHSDNYGFPTELPSQRYSIELVRSAIGRGAVIVVLRAWSLWTAALPELAQYARAFKLRNRQRVWVTEDNCPDGFATIAAAIEESTACGKGRAHSPNVPAP